MSDVQKASLYLENSILKSLLQQNDITDISFNGESIFYQSSVYGRRKATFTLTYEEAYQLIKQLANLMNMPFTFMDAIVDMSIARYRIFAVGPSVSRKQYEPSLTFSIRIHPKENHVVMKFLTQETPWFNLFKFLIDHDVSIVIAGKTGSGKTQLQKELLMLMSEAKRVIILDNILELDGLWIPGLDLTVWQIKPMYSIQTMVEGALRSHPDWLVIAESRGAEFKQVLRSVKTGHPIITTLHSDRIDRIYERMVSMLLIDESMSHAEQLKSEVIQAFPVLIQLVSHELDGGIHRLIDQVSITHHDTVHRLNKDVDVNTISKVIQSW
jgi:pilus assembly protein CpaF